MSRKIFHLTPRLILEHARSPVVAVSEHVFGRAFALDSNEPAAPSAMSPQSKGVALMRIDGPLLQRASYDLCGFADGYDAIAARFSLAMLDPSVAALVLVIDSPGGDCAGLFECVASMCAAREAAGKPVFAYVDELCASAAYALAMVASEGVYAPRSADVGSIGCLAVHVDATAAAAKEGFSYQVFRSGPRKAEGSSIEPLSPIAAAAIQQRVDDLAMQFFEIVSASRGIPILEIAALGGACFGAPAALAAKLIDGIASLETVATMAGSSMPSELGDPMTDAEKQEMDDLKTENAKLKERARQSEKEAEEAKKTDPPPPPPPPAKAPPSSDGEGAPSPEEQGDGDDDDDDKDDDDAKTKKAKAKSRKLKAELAETNARHAAEKAATEIVDAAIKSGKIVPASRGQAIKTAVKHGTEDFADFTSLLPSGQLSKEHKEKESASGSGSVVVLTAEDKKAARSLGLTEKQFAITKAAMAEEELEKK